MVSLPSERFTRFGNPAWPGLKTANFAALGAWSETLLKNAESLRNSDALMRVAVPRRRGPARLFSFVEIALVRPTLRAFYTCKVWGCYHCSRYALRIVKVFRAQVSKRLTFVPTLRSW